MKLFEQLTWRVQKKLTQWQESTKNFHFQKLKFLPLDIAGRMHKIFSDNKSFEFSKISAYWHKFPTHHNRVGTV